MEIHSTNGRLTRSIVLDMVCGTHSFSLVTAYQTAQRMRRATIASPQCHQMRSNLLRQRPTRHHFHCTIQFAKCATVIKRTSGGDGKFTSIRARFSESTAMPTSKSALWHHPRNASPINAWRLAVTVTGASYTATRGRRSARWPLSRGAKRLPRSRLGC